MSIKVAAVLPRRRLHRRDRREPSSCRSRWPPCCRRRRDRAATVVNDAHVDRRWPPCCRRSETAANRSSVDRDRAQAHGRVAAVLPSTRPHRPPSSTRSGRSPSAAGLPAMVRSPDSSFTHGRLISVWLRVAGEIDRGRRDVSQSRVVRIGDHEAAAGYERQAADVVEPGIERGTSVAAEAGDSRSGERLEMTRREVDLEDPGVGRDEERVAVDERDRRCPCWP